MKWMIMPLLRYADFTGRSRRLEYWMFTLFLVLAFVAIMMLAFLMGGVSSDPEAPMPGIVLGLLIIFFLGIFIPSLAVQVRRMHDQDRTGWWLLISFIPYIGSLVMLIFMLIPGTKGHNDYGPDPKEPEGADLVEVFH